MAKLFYDEHNNYIGFCDKVLVKDKEILVDTRTGKGYDEVIAALKDMVGYLAGLYNIEGNTVEDNKQHIIMRILEGIPKYQPGKNTKLSSFLQMRISRRMINDIRDQNRFRRNATYLNTRSFTYHCVCGADIADSTNIQSCVFCGLPIDGAKKKWVRQCVVYMSEFKDGYSTLVAASNMADKRANELDLIECIEEEDSRTQKIIAGIYFDGKSVSELAEECDISTAAVYMKIKKLRRNKRLKALLYGGGNEVNK